jgi:hypothetical protein
MKKWDFGYCGLDCKVCPVFIAKENDDTPLRIKTAYEWSELYAEHLGGNSLKAEVMNCSGCQSEKDIFIGCTTCPIRQCCREKELTTCALCSKYQTCEILNGFYSVSSHQQAKDNLDRIRRNG